MFWPSGSRSPKSSRGPSKEKHFVCHWRWKLCKIYVKYFATVNISHLLLGKNLEHSYSLWCHNLETTRLQHPDVKDWGVDSVSSLTLVPPLVNYKRKNEHASRLLIWISGQKETAGHYPHYKEAAETDFSESRLSAPQNTFPTCPIF